MLMKKKFKEYFNDKDFYTVMSNIVGAFIIKGMAMFVSMYTMTAYLRYFSDAQYLGIWLTIVSVLNWIMTFDLGIGNGLRNHLTNQLAVKKYDTAKIYISSAYIVLGIVSVIGFIISSLLAVVMDWNQILKVDEVLIPANILRWIMLISFANVFTRFFLNLISSVLYALQKTFAINMISLITNVALLGYLFVMNSGNDVEALLKLSVAQFVAANIPLLIGTILVFSTTLRGCWPRFKLYNSRIARNVLSLGGAFFVAQLEMLLLNATNEFVINSLYGSAQVVEYQVYYKLFSIPLITFTIICQPIWSAITKAAGECDKVKVKKYYQGMRLVAALGCIGTFAVVLIIKPFFRIWLGEEAIVARYDFAFVFLFFTAASMCSSAATCLANGLGKVTIQVVYLALALVIKYILVAVLLYYPCGDWFMIVLMNAFVLAGLALVQSIHNKKLIREVSR